MDLHHERMRYEDYGGIKGVSSKGFMQNLRNHIIKSTGEASLRKFIRQKFIQTLFSNFPTEAGFMLRGKVYKSLLGGVGSSCFIDKGVRFFVPQNVSFGDRVLVGESCFLDNHTPDSRIRVGDDVHISPYSILRSGPEDIDIHDHVFIGPFAYIIGNGGLEIGKNTIIAKNITLMTQNHIFEDPEVPIKYQGNKLEKITIGEDVWLGANVVVLAGVTVGEGSVVGAGSIVTKDVPPYSVAVGNPAKVIKRRGIEQRGTPVQSQ